MSHRLFTAIRPPDAVRESLIGMMGGVEGARWQADGQLHLTLRFVGEVDRRTSEDVELALSRVRHEAVEIAIEGVGLFDRRGRPETLWAGIRPNPSLTELHRKIDRALITAGLPPEGRAYKPHVTLARFSRRGGAVRGFIERHAGLSLPAWTATSFALFESRLSSEGAHYEEIAVFRLG